MEAYYSKHILKFNKPSGTSRGVLRQKETWFIIIQDKDKVGIGECGLLPGLSIDDQPDYESKLQWTCDHIDLGFETLWERLISYTSFLSGLEQYVITLTTVHSSEL